MYINQLIYVQFLSLHVSTIGHLFHKIKCLFKFIIYGHMHLWRYERGVNPPTLMDL
jgi:hypothetical protein